MNKEKPNLNTKMWNSGYPMMEYVVRAVIRREKNVQYELYCANCRHSGEKCRILITENDNGHYVYVGMVNEDYDDDISERNYYFHRNNGNFHCKKENAEIEKVEKYISNCKKEIKKHKEAIEFQEASIKEYEDRISAYKELLKNCEGSNKNNHTPEEEGEE